MHTALASLKKVRLTFPEVIEMRQKHFGVVHGGEPQKVVLAHLAQLFAVSVLEHGRVDLHQAVLLDGPLQPLAHVILGPQRRVCAGGRTKKKKRVQFSFQLFEDVTCTYPRITSIQPTVRFKTFEVYCAP